MTVLKLTEKNFKKTIEENPFVIVDFWAKWCAPCVEFTPIFKAAAKNNSDIVFGMVDTESNSNIATYFEVAKIPSLLIIREQAGIHAQQGAIGAPALDALIEWARQFDTSAIKNYYRSLEKSKS